MTEDEELRLECLKLVWPKDNASADVAHYTGKAQALYAYVTGTRITKADKPTKGPARSV